ncbi:MAG TPA: DUF2911 domain-containing protein [Chitinophagales bacterium]|nr:DUF2911 domain-containing protein [Chitinophagales bacterium]
MKKINIFKAFTIASLLGVGFLQADLNAQALKTPVASTTQKIIQGFALSEIHVEYSRPSTKGREIFGELVPFGKVWRTGANNSTRITFGDDVKVNGTDVKAGTYAIYTIPNEKVWTLTLYSDLKLGGSVADYDKKNEVVSLQLPVHPLADKVETFTIQINNITHTSANISLAWENTQVSFDVTTEIDDKVMAGIESALKDNRPYAQAASYYYENGKDLNQAYEWIQIATKQAPYAFWLILTQAKIENALGHHDAAIATANLSKAKATEAKNNDYVKMCDQLIEQINTTKKTSGKQKK